MPLTGRTRRRWDRGTSPNRVPFRRCYGARYLRPKSAIHVQRAHSGEGISSICCRNRPPNNAEVVVLVGYYRTLSQMMDLW